MKGNFYPEALWVKWAEVTRALIHFSTANSGVCREKQVRSPGLLSLTLDLVSNRLQFVLHIEGLKITTFI